LLGTDKYFFSGESNLLFVVFVPTNVARREAEGWSVQKPEREAAYEATADVAGGDVEQDADVEGQLLKFKLLVHTICRYCSLCSCGTVLFQTCDTSEVNFFTKHVFYTSISCWLYFNMSENSSTMKL
jgi:hypothetical protein